ncbi:hypothetical protein BPIT_04850 [Candidatus Brocadia pituitae]|nr:hypothetical protein BPIT_04850 [Candidatus Brocadia pituitae]
MPEIEMLNPILKGLFKDVEAKDENKIYVHDKNLLLVHLDCVRMVSIDIVIVMLSRGIV